MSDYDVIVIGAGLGGLSAGAMLAKQGFKTLVCEHNSRVGGCCSSFEHEGYTFDMGASIVEMAWIIDELFARVFEEFGGEIRFDSTVRRILMEGNRAVGVELADGTQIRSRLVLSNINAKTLYLDLIGRDKIPGWAARAVDSYELSIPCPMIMLGMDAAPELEAHHTICYGTMQETNSAYFDYFKKGKLHDGGMMIICWPTNADPSLAPEGHHALNIVTLAPYDLAEGDWDSMKDAYLETMLNAVEKKFHINLRDHITTAKVNTPKDFERALLHPRGAVYGLNNDLFSTAMFRPGLRSRVVKGLYLAGASTHFGGGVPTTVGSGVAVSGLIEKDFS